MPAPETSPSEDLHPPGSSPEPAETSAPSLRSHLDDVLASLRRLADLQLGIWLIRVKMTVLHIILCTAICLLAAVFVFIALVFLYAGLYHVLTNILLIPTVWALLLFAGLHFLLAGILALVAIALLKRGPAGVQTRSCAMSLAADLQDLRAQQRREIALLRTRIAAVADTLGQQASPARCVCEHPYATTAGAALIGFAAAQWPRKPAPSAPQPVPLTPAPASHLVDLLSLLAALARRFLPGQPDADSPPPPASLTVAELGCITSASFPPMAHLKL